LPVRTSRNVLQISPLPFAATKQRRTIAVSRRLLAQKTPFSTTAVHLNAPPAAPPTSTTDPFGAAPTPSPKAATTPLTGLNFLKNQEDPVALADSEYPSWLWTVLNTKKAGGGKDGGEEGDMYCEQSWLFPSFP
jgi:large subunit ribosomal protein L54